MLDGSAGLTVFALLQCWTMVLTFCVFQYCQAISSSCFCRISGPIISMLLDYVGHAHLCSQLLDILESRSDWASIKLKAGRTNYLHPVRHISGVSFLLCLLFLSSSSSSDAALQAEDPLPPRSSEAQTDPHSPTSCPAHPLPSLRRVLLTHLKSGDTPVPDFMLGPVYFCLCTLLRYSSHVGTFLVKTDSARKQSLNLSDQNRQIKSDDSNGAPCFCQTLELRADCSPTDGQNLQNLSDPEVSGMKL